jgi:hypothetical protein
MSLISSNNNQVDQISSRIYQHFNGKYPSLFPSLNITQDNIKKILTSKEEINKTTVEKVVNLLDTKIKNKMYGSNVKTPLNVSHFTIDKNVNISQQKYLENFNPVIDVSNTSNNENDTNTYKKQFESPSEDFPLRQREKMMKMVTPETIDKEFILVIDSKDRDYNSYSSPNDYVIHLSPSDTTSSGYIDRGFSNIKSIELLDIISIVSSSESGATDNGTSFPYLLLEIEELGGQFEGTNNEISKSFTILKNYTTSDGFKYYEIVGNTSSKSIIKVFNPHISLSKLTVRFKTPDGTVFNFGTANDAKTTTVNQLIFRVVLAQKNLATRFMDKSTF